MFSSIASEFSAKGGSSKTATTASGAESKANDFFAQARLELEKIKTQGVGAGVGKADEKTSLSKPPSNAGKEKGKWNLYMTPEQASRGLTAASDSDKSKSSRFGRKSKSPKKK